MIDVARIREAVAADAGALAPLSVQLGYPADASTIARRLDDIEARRAGVVLVAVDARGSISGFAQVESRRLVFTEAFVELAALVVAETARGQGIGAQLLEAAEAWARGQQGFAAMRVRSNVVRERAHRFYLREGFAEMKRQAVFEKRLPAEPRG